MNTTGAVLRIEILSASTIPLDVHLEGEAANGLVDFANGRGRTWSCAANAIPLTLRRDRPWLFLVPVVRSASTGGGAANEVIRCQRVRYRNHGLQGWGTWRTPKKGNAIVVDIA